MNPAAPFGTPKPADPWDWLAAASRRMQLWPETSAGYEVLPVFDRVRVMRTPCRCEAVHCFNPAMAQPLPSLRSESPSPRSEGDRYPTATR